MNPIFGTNYYEVLGVAQSATEKEIKKAYARIAKRYHPDLAHDEPFEDAQAIFGRIVEAYRVLSDAESRIAYDRALASKRPVVRPPLMSDANTLQSLDPEARQQAARESILPAHFLFDEGRFWNVIQLLEAAVPYLSGEQRSEASVLLARAYAQIPDLRREAEAVLLSVLRDDCKNVDAHLLLAKVYEQVGLKVRAQTMSKEAGALQQEGKARMADRALGGVTCPSQIGPYRILGELGRGVIGTLYSARGDSLGRDVTIKVLPPDQAADPMLRQLLRREAQVLGQLSDPNVVVVHNVGYHRNDSPYIVMEALQGRDLGQTLLQSPPMTLERRVEIILSVLAGLNHVHRKDIVHRNIHPASIFIRDDGLVKIIDFSIVSFVVPGRKVAAAGRVFGPPSYMSPEQARGGVIDGRSDIFSVGCVLYEMLAGKKAFEGESVTALVSKIIAEEPDFDLIPAGPGRDELLPILKRSLAKGLEDRYPDATSMSGDLRPLILKARPARRSQQVRTPPSTPGPQSEQAPARGWPAVKRWVWGR